MPKSTVEKEVDRRMMVLRNRTYTTLAIVFYAGAWLGLGIAIGAWLF